MASAYVCAFRGRRDSYQVPIALAEIGRLEAFVTDHFCASFERLAASVLPRRLADRVLSRQEPRIPEDRVVRLRYVAMAEAITRTAGMASASIYTKFDPEYGKAAAKIARRSKSDLFLYSSYAWEAFIASYRHDPRRVLFQFHPHIRQEVEILAADRRRNTNDPIAFSGELDSGAAGPTEARLKSDSAWARADHVVCASSFTKRSLVDEGADPAIISVIPYGVDMPPEAVDDHPAGGEGLGAIFVGSGLQRKGLHHLLAAWQRAGLPRGSRLTVVSRTLDPALIPLLRRTEGVEHLPGVSRDQLSRLYRQSDLFVMPSLVEGFGQVYLEALAHGVPVLGTENTCCPDLGDEDDGIFLTKPGSVDALVAALESLAARLAGDHGIRDRARACARRFTWEAFRRGMQDIALATA
jgi:glycosyltransferase involved in cell wall biosynthesis